MPITYEQLEKENSELRSDLAQSEREVKGRCNDLADASKEIADLRAKLAAAEAELSALREDKARLDCYLKLHSKIIYIPSMEVWQVGYLTFIDLRQAIDAARKQTE